MHNTNFSVDESDVHRLSLLSFFVRLSIWCFIIGLCALPLAAYTFTITPTAGPNGAIDPNTPQTVDSGAEVIFTAMPDTGYAVDTWSLDGIAAQTGGTIFTLTNITADHTINVTFKTQTSSGPGDWWMFHHDRQHTGRSPFTGPSTPTQKWAFATGGLYTPPRPLGRTAPSMSAR